LNETLLTAVKPPNRFTRPSTTSTRVPHSRDRHAREGGHPVRRSGGN
jgi:hypothetical protein